MGVAGMIAPRGSRPRRFIQQCARPVFGAVRRLEKKVMAGYVPDGEAATTANEDDDR
ncbi:hypothetical protein D3C83_304890 [compost metagenome]